MGRDFTVKTYFRILQSLQDSEYVFLTYADYQASSATFNRCVILRHDVDADPEKALEFAKLEKSINVKATYYFKTCNGVFDKNIIKEIAGLGHEIGYHYEDLSKAQGDVQKAIQLYEKNLSILRQFYPVKTICMDGSIFSKWNNLDLWKHFDYQDYGIIGEPYLDIDFNKVLYLTDTGREWNALKYSLYDKVNTRFNYYYKSTFDIIRDINAGKLPDQLMITTHPQRWHDNQWLWTKELMLQSLKNSIKYWIIRNRKRQLVEQLSQ